MDFELEGTTALTIASSSGLGKASATALAREGANVVVNGRDQSKLDSAVEEIQSVATGEVIGKRGSITNPGDIAEIVDATVDEFGQLDHLVTSAGGPPRRRFAETADDEWYEAYDLLVMSVVRTIRESLPYLEDGGGSIVNVTSRVTKEPRPSNILSSSVRSCVPGLMKALSRELAPDVRINTVRPGPYKTPRNDPETWEDKRKAIPLNRLGESREFGEVVAFLCSERSSYLTGASIPVDGGASHSW